MTTIAEVSKDMPSVGPGAPLRWLAAGWRDMLAAPLLSIGYGIAVVGVSVGLIWFLWAANLGPYIFAAFGVFCLAGPMLALSLYELSRALARGEKPHLFPVRLAGKRSLTQLAYIGFILTFAALIWLRVAIMIFAMFASSTYMPMEDFARFALLTGPGVAMLIVGSVFGGVIAFAIYLTTVISIPMLMNEKTDAFTAIAAGIIAFKENTPAMLLWALLIAVICAAGVATAFVGLAIAFPLLGHATWHAYSELRPAAGEDMAAPGELAAS